MTDARRVRAIELLLETSELYLGASPFPKCWSGYARAEPGQAPSRKDPCRVCAGARRTLVTGRPCVACRNGQPLSSHACVPCASCGGAGTEWVDAYTGAVVKHAERRVKRAAPGGARARSHAVRAAGLEEQAGSWETAQRKQEAEGSYAALRVALGRLAQGDAASYRVIVAVYVRGDRRELTELERRRLARGMVLLDAMMPRPVRLPLWLGERLAGEQRIRAAADAHAAGASLGSLRLRGRHKRALRALGAT